MSESVAFIASLIVFTGVYFGITSVVGFIAWRPLARYFTFVDPIDGEKLPFSHMAVNGVNYKSSVILKACPMGLRMSVPFIIRLSHPPLLIPWHAFVAVEKRTFFVARYTLVIGEPKIGTITVSRAVYEAVAPYLSVRACE